MKEKGISSQTELAALMNITKGQLSVILSKQFQPVKKNVMKLCDTLGLDFIDILNINKDYSIFDMKELTTKPDRYIDTSKVIKKRKYTTVEVFAGAGGLALGLEQAGFHTLGLIEKDKHACQTLRLNRPNWNVIEDDIVNVTKRGLMNYFDNDDISNIDLLAGGPPCQSFSTAGKRRGLDDTRGNMFKYYVRALDVLRPRMCLFENVTGLVHNNKGRALRTIIKALSNAGYTLKYKVLNSWDYGVAQRRERIIIVGIRDDLLEQYNVEYRFPKPYKYKPVLRDILNNVPASKGAKFTKEKKEILELIPPGGNWRDLPDDIARKYLGKMYDMSGGKAGIGRRLSWDEPSLTITCAPSMMKAERIHPTETRPFTVRECTRIQSYPDEWVFAGFMTETYRQIGNAVCVSLAKAIGLSIIHTLNEIEEK
jgi:DNA (cytosine-5)-methyltransferase 1